MTLARTIDPELLEGSGFFNLLAADFTGEQEGEKELRYSILASFDRLHVSVMAPIFVHGRHVIEGTKLTFVFDPLSGDGWGCEGHIDLSEPPFWCMDCTRLAMPVGFQALKVQLPARLRIPI